MYYVCPIFEDQTFNPLIVPYQVLPFRVRVDQGAILMMGYSTFPKAPELLHPRHQIV